jgi:ribosomal protein S18 acetylase RimI-like enzyme
MAAGSGMVNVVQAQSVDELLKVRCLFGEYAASLGIDLCCEMKRLYVREPFRSAELGLILAQRIIDEARQAGYQRMRLDSLPFMVAALGLYRRLGFREIAPYRPNPVPGAIFLELQLMSPPHDA